MIDLLGTTFQNPVLLASGTAGFGRELAAVVDLEALGGVITKSVSVEPRSGNPAPRVAEFSGGMLNSVGLANPGVEAVAEGELPWLAAHLTRARVLVSVVGNTMQDYAAVVRRLETYAVVVAFELNLSCPNTARGGEHFGADDTVLHELVTRCADATRKPLVAKLAPTLPDMGRTAAVAARAGAAAISVVNTLPGFLYRDAAPRAARLGAGQGGVSGPALLPVGVLATRRVRVATGLPVIGVGGIRSVDDARQYLAAGASLVAIGTSGLADPRVPERIARTLAADGSRVSDG
ncbi:MAG TPA: dihydroorotate dehydrogenase [Gemmatimonadales bacterium]|nr:dihydroorotate dehydrogenase [Gemmatimonadales bacterium]